VSLRRGIRELACAGNLVGLGLPLAGCSAPGTAPTLPVPDAAPMRPDVGHPTGDRTSPAADAGAAPKPLACPPAPERYMPQSYVPAVAHQGVCNAAEIAVFLTACVPGPCPSWNEENRAGFVEGGAGTPCGNCLFAPKNNGGAWNDPDGYYYPNYGGCTQLLDPLDGPACAAAVDDFNGCSALACEYCPGFAPNDLADCIHAVSKGACAPYLTTANSSCSAAYDAFTACTSNLDSTANWTYVTTLICGSVTADGGPDAAGD